MWRIVESLKDFFFSCLLVSINKLSSVGVAGIKYLVEFYDVEDYKKRVDKRNFTFILFTKFE